MFANNGAIAQRFTNHSKNFVGNKIGTPPTNSQYSQYRQNAQNDIYDTASNDGVSVDTVVTGILKNDNAQLKAYVVSKGETPVSDPVGLALQAILLRANDISTTANILDSDDITALLVIEAAESDDIATNSPEADGVLDPVTAAAITCALQFMSDKSGLSLNDVLSNIIRYSKSGRGSSSFLGIDSIGDPSSSADFIDYSIDDPSAADPTDVAASDNSMSFANIGSALAQIPATGSSISVASGFPTISASASYLPQAGPDTSSGGVLNSITSIFNGITQAAGALTTAAGATNQATNSIRNIGSNIGAASIQQYVQNNMPMILLLIVIIIVAVYVARK